jgi:hypothetical protein
MDKFQGIFDQGFSGILEDSTRKTMPSFLEKLAEQEIAYNPAEVEPMDITFDKNMALTRADELTSRVSRDVNKENRFTVEKTQRNATEEKLKEIDKTVEGMLSQGKDFEEMQKHLLDKYPKESVNQYLESKVRLILNKFSFLGFSDIPDKQATITEQSKVKNQIKRAFVTDLLKKFSKLEYVSSDVVKEFKSLLDSKRPLKVACKFLFSLDKIKKAFYADNVNDRIAFSRDVDKVNIQPSEVKDNEKRNTVVRNQNIYATMLTEYKELLYSKLDNSEIAKIMSKDFGVEKYQKFASVYANDIQKISKFYERQSFSTDFASATKEAYELIPKNKEVKINANLMFNFASQLMSEGERFATIKKALEKKFGSEATLKFLGSSECESHLQKHYGQLGYIYIDSNIYTNCDEMYDSFKKMQHIGKKLIFNVKANSKCTTCTLNKKGECQKVNLLISNNPIVRSSRAAKKVFIKAATFMPKTYIEAFSKEIKQEDSNKELVSKFALGMQSALDEAKQSQDFNNNFVRSAEVAYTLEPQNKPIEIDVNLMLNEAFSLMSNGEKIEVIKTALNKKFDSKATKMFLNSYEKQLQNHYGQLGFVFIDSNIYSNCDEMKDDFSKMQHVGSKLISSLKANSKCKGCILNKEGMCQKVDLIISANPVVRSSRAAKKLFVKAATFVPQSYIDSFIKELKSDDSNKELISKFALGIETAFEDEMKNIGKRASKDRNETTEDQESFIAAESFNVDLFKKENTSRIIDSVIQEK